MDFYLMLAVALLPVIALGVVISLRRGRMDHFDDNSRHPGMVSGSLQMRFDDARTENRHVVDPASVNEERARPAGRP